MESEIGRVIEVCAGSARVEISQSSLCAHCEVASSCVPGTAGKRIVKVLDPLGISVGQRVRIELSSAKLLWASFLAYLVPLLFLFAGAILGFYSARSTMRELWGGMGAIAGLTAGLLISRLLGQYLGRRGKLAPTITAVIAEEDRKNRKDAD